MVKIFLRELLLLSLGHLLTPPPPWPLIGVHNTLTTFKVSIASKNSMKHGLYPCDKIDGPFRVTFVTKKWKISLFIGYSSWYKHAINKFLIDSSASCCSQDIQVFEKLHYSSRSRIKSMYITIGHVNDFALNWVLYQNDYRIQFFLCFGILY